MTPSSGGCSDVRPGRPRRCGRAGLPQPGRLRPAGAAPGRRRRLGNNGQRPRSDFREAPPGPAGITTKRSTTTTMCPDPHQDSRRGRRLPPQARPGRRFAGRPARHWRPAAHRPRRHRPRTVMRWSTSASSRVSPTAASMSWSTGACSILGWRRSSGPACEPACRSCSRAPPVAGRPPCSPAAPPNSTRAYASWWPRRCSRPTSHCRTWPRCRPARPAPTGGRSTFGAGFGLPPHGPRHRCRRRSERQRGVTSRSLPTVQLADQHRCTMSGGLSRPRIGGVGAMDRGLRQDVSHRCQAFSTGEPGVTPRAAIGPAPAGPGETTDAEASVFGRPRPGRGGSSALAWLQLLATAVSTRCKLRPISHSATQPTRGGASGDHTRTSR